MSKKPLRTSTALVASLSLLLPHGILVSPATAQEMVLLCLSGELPPCPEGEPIDGTPFSVADLNAAAEQAAAEQAAAEQAAAEQAAAEQAAAEQAAAEQAAAEQAAAEQAAAEQAAAEQAAAEQAAAEQAAAEQAAAEQAAAEQAAAEQAAAEQAAAEQAAAEQAAAEQAAAEQAAAEQAAAEQAAADQAAADQAAADQAAADQAAADQAAADQAAADQAAADTAAETSAQTQALVDRAFEATEAAESFAIGAKSSADAGDIAAAQSDREAAVSAMGQASDAILLATEAAQAADDAAALVQLDDLNMRLGAMDALIENADAAIASATEAAAPAVDEATEVAPETEEATTEEATTEEAVTEEAVTEGATDAGTDTAPLVETATPEAETLEDLGVAEGEAMPIELLVEESPVVDEAVIEALPEVDPTVADVTEDPSTAALLEDTATDVETVSPDAEVTEEVVTETDTRTSDEDFDTTVTTAATTEADPAASSGGKSGLSNFEKALLIGLGAVVVGSILGNGDEVVANSGDRVVVKNPEGGYTVYKDDDALLRQPGSTVRTETFTDGSTRTFLTREDGSQVVTIRDARGRVLRRSRVLADGTQVELLNDLAPAPAVNVRELATLAPRARSFSASQYDRDALRAALSAGPVYNSNRGYSLRQIREIRQVRDLMPGIDLDTIIFPSGSAAIPTEQTRSIVRLGLLIEEFLAENPSEVFLIEGHTDAVGSAVYNLALSDRRAETVALALTENFNISPENLVMQGYGEEFLKIDSQADEPGNRRATVRRITPLLRDVASN